MGITVPFCDTPEQAAAIGVGSGLLGGLAGVAGGLDVLGVALLAGALALVGELLGHAARGDIHRWLGLDAGGPEADTGR